MRAMFVISFCFLMAACHGVSIASIAVAPRPDVGNDSSAQAAFQIVARVAEGRGLTPCVAPDTDEEGWRLCYSLGMFHMFGKVKNREVQVRMVMLRTFRFTPWAKSTKKELLDSLRVHFGESAVRECSWRTEEPPQTSGCPTEYTVPSKSP